MSYSPAMVAIIVMGAAVSLGGFVTAAIWYMGTVNKIGTIIREKKPSGRSLFSFDGKPWRSEEQFANPIQLTSVYRLVLGATVLDISDDRYWQLLSSARKYLIVCAVFWMAIVIEIGWFFQNSMLRV